MRATMSLLVVGGLLALSFPLFAGEDGQGEVALGASSVSRQDSQNRAGEFEAGASSAALFAWWTQPLNPQGKMNLDLKYLADNDQQHALVLKPSHSWTFNASFLRLRHSQPHDPLTNLETYDTQVKVVRHTDWDAGKTNNYSLGYEENHLGATFRPEANRAWFFSLSGHRQVRQGTVQHLSASHCANCHIAGQSRRVDQAARDLVAAVGYERPHWGIVYKMIGRDFEERAARTLRTFDDARHPGTLLYVFGNRVTFDDGAGPVPVGLVTGHQRNVHILRGYWNGARDSLQAYLGYSRVEADRNIDPYADFGGAMNPGLEAKYTTGLVRWQHFFPGGVTFGARGKYERLTSDDIFIDQPSTLSTAGPTAGYTYEQIYGSANVKGWGDRGFVTDWTRKSPADRKVWTLGGDLIYPLGGAGKHRLKVSLTAKNTDRDNLEVTDEGDTETTEYRLRGLLTGRPSPKLHYTVDGEVFMAENQVSNVDGGCLMEGTDERAATGSTPLAPYGPWTMLQYFELHQLRFANLSNQPTDGLALRGKVTLVPSANTTWVVQAKLARQTNDETQVSEWARDVMGLGASLWWTPNSRLYATGSLDWLKDDQETHICIPLWDG